MVMVLDNAEETYFYRTPAHQFRQGGRDVYFFSMNVETADGLLPERIDDQVIRDANRKLTPEHAKNIQRYLAEQDGWLLGALMLGIAPEAVEFTPFSEGSSFGELRIKAAKANTRRIFDGQHRRRAIRDVIVELKREEDDSSKQRLRDLLSASLTVVLYAEDDIPTLRQMFVDASKTKAIESHTVARFNSRDPFNLVAQSLSERSSLFRHRIDMERSSASRTGYYLLSINQLVSTLKKLHVGSGRRISKEMSKRFVLEIDELTEKSKKWTDRFLPASRPEYADIVSGRLSDRDIPAMRTKTFAFSVTFINLLADSYRLWLVENPENADWEHLAKFISGASIEVGARRGLLVDAGLVTPDGRSLFSRRQELEAAARYIVAQASNTKQG